MVSNQETINSFSNTRIPHLLVWERSIREKSHASERRCIAHMTERKEGREGSKGLAQAEWIGVRRRKGECMSMQMITVEK